MTVDAITAMREQRFVYKAPKQGLLNKLAHVYVQRKKWGKRAAIASTTGIVAYGAHYQFVKVKNGYATPIKIILFHVGLIFQVALIVVV